MNRFFLRTAPALVALIFPGLALAAAADEPLPFRGVAHEVVTDSAPLGPGLLQLTVTTTGQATHLGKFTGTEVVVFNPTAGTLMGARVFIAANGDRLYATVEGAFTSATTAEGTLTFTGGTGRFRDASGEVAFKAVSPDGLHLALTFEGTIEY
jgi:hypothetical protein